MPRPGMTRGASRETPEKKKGFTSWLEERKDRKKRREEEAARIINEAAAGAESDIVRILTVIDFENSRLPKEVLEKKTDPNQPFCNLERNIRALAKDLTDSTQILEVDIKPIDEQLLKLARQLQESVEYGYASAAEAAKAGLARGIREIRMKLPKNPEIDLKEFVEVNAKYLSEFVVLVGMAQDIDQEEKNRAIQKAGVDKAMEAAKKERDELRNKLLHDEEYKEALGAILDNDGNREFWTPFQWGVHASMVESSMKRTVNALSVRQLSDTENQLSVLKGKKEMIATDLKKIPVVADPNQMNKVKEAVEAMFDRMAKADVELEENIKFFDEIDGRIKQFEHLPGSIKAKEKALEEAQKLLGEMQHDQEIEINGGVGGEQFRNYGLYTDEEKEQLKAEREKARTQERAHAEEKQAQRIRES